MRENGGAHFGASFYDEENGLADGSHRQRFKTSLAGGGSQTAFTAEVAENSRARTTTEDHRTALNLFLGFAQRHTHIHLFLAAENGDADCVAGAVLVHHLGEALLVFDFFAVDGDDEIAA